MGHHAYTRVGGNWTDSVDTLTAADLESFEAKIFKSINGDDGGTWAPAGTLVIGGAGVDLQGANHVLSGTLTVDGDIQLDGVLEVGSGLGSVTFGGTTGRPLLGSRQLHRTSWNVVAADANWGISVGAVVASNTSVNYAQMVLDHLPHGSSLNEVWMYVDGVLSGAILPTSMPTLEVWKVNVATGAATQIGTTATDGSGDQATFEAPHLLRVFGLTETIDRQGFVYYARVSSPNGGNTLAGFTAYAPTSYFTVTQMDDGAA